MFKSSSLRLALLYTAAFSLAVVLLGVVTGFATRAALSQQFDARIQTESAALVQEYRTEGLEGLRQAVGERDVTAGALDYGLQGPDGRGVAGSLAQARTPMGWTTLRMADGDEPRQAVRVLTRDLPGGYRLLVGDDTERVESLDGLFLRSFAWTLAMVLLLGLAGGYLLSRDMHRRLSAISATAQAIIEGDLARRVPTGGSGDDLDQLAATFNRMLDRIAALMDSLKQVSTDIAHDLRTPLTRLRQRLEADMGRARDAETVQSLEAALAELDEILGAFAALLRIAQIESGARRAGFQPLNLAEVVRNAGEAFMPAAEDAGQVLEMPPSEPIALQGDRELLTQMVANLVENALLHAGPGARVLVRTFRQADGAVLVVEDSGPGVPAEAYDRLFDRLYRLERSRSTPGNGLGLALVAAVAHLHRAEIALADAGPGLRVTVSFPPA